MNKKIESVPSGVMDALVRYSWPGNVRELQNFIERAVILSPTSVLRAPVGELELSESAQTPKPGKSRLAQAERDHIIRALEDSNWVVGGQMEPPLAWDWLEPHWSTRCRNSGSAAPRGRERNSARAST